jgi:hypothetical protein
LSSLNPIYSNPWPWLWVDMRFREGYVNVTMTNRDYIISEIILSRARTILAGELLHEPISRGEQISICINFNWISHVLYEIIVRTTEGKSTLVGTWAPENATRAPSQKYTVIS